MLFSAGKRDFPFQARGRARRRHCDADAMENVLCARCVWTYLCSLLQEQRAVDSRAHTHMPSSRFVIDSRTREQYLLLFSLSERMRKKEEDEEAPSSFLMHRELHPKYARRDNRDTKKAVWEMGEWGFQIRNSGSAAIVDNEPNKTERKTLRKRKQLKCNKCSASNGGANSFIVDLFYCKYGNFTSFFSSILSLRIRFYVSRECATSVRRRPCGGWRYARVCVCMRSALIFGSCAHSTCSTQILHTHKMLFQENYVTNPHPQRFLHHVRAFGRLVSVPVTPHYLRRSVQKLIGTNRKICVRCAPPLSIFGPYIRED